MIGMNRLSVAQRAQILAMLCEGSSMLSISRLADASINTVSKLLVDAERFFAGFHDAKVKGVKAPMDGAGDVWIWTATVAAMDGDGPKSDMRGPYGKRLAKKAPPKRGFSDTMIGLRSPIKAASRNWT
ncbi:MAG: hypothetical protein IOC90_10730 [Methylocystis sp.]|nr:hypothetical protein [Methylocystis sp.]MCA3582776.1 hypothetical protein [Methylocystis sp.]MCA3588492.1 hypothetical protein [Methylocystis sp.]MCA3592073.1 hypothetical protein [Methylocystis sp.]